MTTLKRTNDTTTDPPNSESGVSLPLVALMMVTLLGLAAFAVDLGWFYLNASRIQRAADASALAGVIHMPSDPTEAATVAHEVAQANGYEDLGVPGGYPTVVATTVPAPTQLRVTITDQVPTFFLKVFGMSSQVITKTAQAEFVPPLPLGSPENQFGNSCDPIQPGCVGQPNFWANIHGRYTDTISGDAFSSACLNKTGSPCISANENLMFRDDADQRPGYLYGIDANGQSSFEVEFTDLAFHNESGGNPTGDLIRTGDHSCGSSDPVTCGPTVRVALYVPDTTPLDVTDSAPICTADIVPEPQVLVTDSYDWESPGGCFTVNSPDPGVYILQVRILSSGPDPIGLNRYAVRSSPGTRLYAVGDMSIFNNSQASVTSFHLAEVSDIYAGKTFVVELYDSGDSSANGTLELIDPSGFVFNDGPCDIYSRTLVTDDWVLKASPVDCAEEVIPQEYNGKWLKFQVVLPEDYSCTDCWWKMNYDYSGGTQDTTTWRAYMLGNPIHLVPLS
jgi:hypothetical protein